MERVGKQEFTPARADPSGALTFPAQQHSVADRNDAEGLGVWAPY